MNPFFFLQLGVGVVMRLGVVRVGICGGVGVGVGVCINV